MRVEANKEYRFHDDQFLFNYIDLHKLIYFLYSAKLFFSPLSYFDDPLEGISQTILLESDPNGEQREKGSIHPRLQDDEKKEHYRNYLENVQGKLFASCWFLGTRESLAMWEAYSNNDSVALRFKADYLCNTICESFRKINEEDFDVMVHGKVEYFKLSPLDETDESLKNCGHNYSGFIKDLSYKHEEEFRFLLMQKNLEKKFRHYEFSPGDLTQLDFAIITHPYMENWKFKNIETVLGNIGIKDKLVRSEIPTRRQIFKIG